MVCYIIEPGWQQQMGCLAHPETIMGAHGAASNHLVPVDSQNVTKNQTDHRMHVEGPQICQINGWNNSFQNMYGMNRKKLTVWPGKSILCKKNTSFLPILVDSNLNYLT